jgi:hypothetical protein
VHGDRGLRDAVVSAGLRAEALLCAVLAVLAAARWTPGIRRGDRHRRRRAP